MSAALEMGCRLIDTATAYGNEAAVGRAGAIGETIRARTLSWQARLEPIGVVYLWPSVQ